MTFQELRFRSFNSIFRQDISQVLTFVLQAPFSVSFNLHLAQLLGALVLQQSSLSLQLPQRCLDFLPATHLIREKITNNVSGMNSTLIYRVPGCNDIHPYLLV